MDPNGKITKKFTKKFDSKVINRQYFHRKTMPPFQNLFRYSSLMVLIFFCYDMPISISYQSINTLSTSVLLESREPNKSLLATSPLLPSGRPCTFPQSMSRILENAKVIYAKYYKNSNEFVPFCFLSDWPVRSILIISAILLKYYIFTHRYTWRIFGLRLLGLM